MSAHIQVRDRLFENIGAADPLPSGAAAPLTSSTGRTAFRPGESLVVTTGAIAVGGMAGLLVLLALGRVEPWALLAAAFTVYGCALYLVSLSMRDVVHNRWSTLPIALFALHFAALLAWPLLTTEWTSASWQWWLGLPASLLALVAFLMLPRVSDSVVYRSSAHVSLIASIAVYEYVWRAMGA